jgi:hypothetical protein
MTERDTDYDSTRATAPATHAPQYDIRGRRRARDNGTD